MPRPRFNERKATQVAAQLLSQAGGKMYYMKLLKLMYLIERESLIRWGSPVTNDSYFSLPKGPILSRVKNLMVEEPDPGSLSFWHSHISSPSEYRVELLDDTGDDELSEAEVKLIDEIYKKFGKWDRFALNRYTHKLPEWEDPEGSSTPISIETILKKAGGKSKERVESITKCLEQIGKAERMFSPAPNRPRAVNRKIRSIAVK